MKSSTKFKIAALALYTVALLALVASCNGQPPETPHQHGQTPSDVHLAALSIQSRAQQPALASQDPPVLVCLLVDFSGSMARYPIRPPEPQAIERLLWALSDVGGSFGYGSIQQNPTDPLERIFFPPPEKPLEIEAATNPFTRKKLRQQYEKELPAFQAREEERRLQNRAQIESFLPHLKNYLSTTPNSPSTDIFSSLSRCGHMLSEDPLYWEEATGHTPERFILAVSDGEHTAGHSAFSPIDRSIHLLVVSGRKGIADFGRIQDVQWFENANSAIRHILTVTKTRR